MLDANDEARDDVASEKKRRSGMSIWAGLAFILPLVAYAAGFSWLGPYLFAWCLVVALAYIVDGQIAELRRERRG